MGEQSFELLVVWIVSIIAAAIVASTRGVSGAAGLAAGILLGPLGVAVAFVMLLTAVAAMQQREAAEAAFVAGLSMKRCPSCDEAVRRAASVCRYCGRDVPKSDAAPSIAHTTRTTAERPDNFHMAPI